MEKKLTLRLRKCFKFILHIQYTYTYAVYITIIFFLLILEVLYFFSNIEERYVNLCKVVRSHALVAFGLTIFEEVTNDVQRMSESLEKRYNVHNFNFSLLSQVNILLI